MKPLRRLARVRKQLTKGETTNGGGVSQVKDAVVAGVLPLRNPYHSGTIRNTTQENEMDAAESTGDEQNDDDEKLDKMQEVVNGLVSATTAMQKKKKPKKTI